MIHIGLTGGIGSGKSTVAKMWQDLGATLLDADQVSRSLTAPHGAAIKAIEQHFGPSVLTPDQALNRDVMRALVFSDASKKALLESILHPMIAQESERQIALARQSGTQVLVHDIPLLVESKKWLSQVDKVLALLLSGQFDEGWRLYEYGWQGSQQRGTPRTYPQPLWLGTDPLVGKTILLHSEQGLGDTLQFCRYVRLVQARGARVMMEVPAPLLPLLESLEGVDEFIVQGQPLPDFDCHCPLMSLPLAFKTDINTIPCPEPYLRSDSAKVAQWKTKLGAKTKPRIGIVWSGRREHRNDHNRSVALLDLMAHLPQAFDYVCLQQEIREADQKALNTSGIQFFGGELKDFSDTAALCDVMDLVISVDTSVAHLAAALGKTTWVLLPYVPDWRWLLDRLDSPWYASVKLWRQQEDRQWGSVLSHIANELRDFAEARVGHESAGIISPCPLPPKFSSVSMP